MKSGEEEQEKGKDEKEEKDKEEEGRGKEVSEVGECRPKAYVRLGRETMSFRLFSKFSF